MAKEKLVFQPMANRNPDCVTEFTFLNGRAASPVDLMDRGAALATHLTAPRVISLTGPLGAGKTHFVKGLVRGFGSTQEVSSPTFTLVHEYEGGRVPIIHFDFYRLESSADLQALGWHDYLRERSIIAVEWGDRIPECLPDDALHVKISIDGDGRLIEIGSIG